MSQEIPAEPGRQFSANPMTALYEADISSEAGSRQFLEDLRLALGAGKVAESYEAVKNAIRRAPGSPVGYAVLVKIAVPAQDMGTLTWAAAVAESAAAAQEDIYIELSTAILALGERERARTVVETGLRFNPVSVRLLLLLGSFCLAEDNFPHAIEIFRKIVKFDPRQLDAWIGLAKATLVTNKLAAAKEAVLWIKNLNHAHPEFLPICQALVTRLPNDRDAWFYLGVAHSYTSPGQHYDYEKAEAAYQRAVDIGPESAEVYFRYGDVLGFQSRWDRVMPLYLKATKLVRREREALGLDKLGIRFLGPDFSRAIGHETMIDMWIKMEQMGWLPPGRTLIFPCDRVANRTLLDYYEPYAHVMTNREREIYAPMLPYLQQHFDCYELADGRGYHCVPIIGLIQKAWEDQQRPPLFTLKQSDRERGWEFLRKMGMPQGSWFVVLHARETGLGPDGKWLPCGENRNAHIETYLESVKWIVEQGGWVIRTGNPSMKKIPSLPHVFDYAHCGQQQDWIDVFLLAECEFFLGSASGPSYVPNVFGKSAASSNWFTLERLPPPQKDLFTPKLVWNGKERRFLTFAEMQADWRVRYTDTYELDRLGLTLVDNSPEELKDLTIEMFNRTRGLERDTDEDNAMQERFRRSISANDFSGRPRIGKAFLRKYAHLLSE